MAGPARVAQAQVAGHLVEGLAHRVVDGGADQAVLPVVVHRHEHGVPARHQQHQQRGPEGRVLQETGVEVGLHVVDGHERHLPDQGEGLGRAHPHEEGAGQPGADGGRHRVELVALEARLHQAAGHHRREQLHVGPAGDLGDHPAEAGVEVDLAGHHRRHHVGAVGDDGRRRLVARRLDAEDPELAAFSVRGRAVVQRAHGCSVSASGGRVVERAAVVQEGHPGDPGLDAFQPLAVVGAVDVVGPHHQRILVRLDVVVLPDAGGGEAELAVELLGGDVGHPHLQGEAGHAPGHALPGEGQQDAAGQLAPVPGGVDGEGGDVAVVAAHHQPAVAGHHPLDPGHVVDPAVAQGQLAHEQPQRPGTGVDLGLDPQHRAQVAPAHGHQVHDQVVVAWSRQPGASPSPSRRWACTIYTTSRLSQEISASLRRR